MLIKSADDKSKRLKLLEDLQRSAGFSAFQREWLRDESIRLGRGIQGERDAAHYLDNYLRDDPARAVIHDLRISIDGEVAQIDHMVLTRAMYIYLLETKCFNGDLHINAQGEFSVEYRGHPRYGIESPIEQSRRHEAVLTKLLERLEISGRGGSRPKFVHCVLVHPKANIHRPKPKEFDSSMVIKADAFPTWHKELQEKATVFDVFGAVLNTRSSETMKSLAEKIVRQHRPVDLLALPDFMSRPATADRGAEATPPIRGLPEAVPTHAPSQAAAASETAPQERKRLICATCGTKISYPEGKYCWNNEVRFGGRQYCREHQAAF